MKNGTKGRLDGRGKKETSVERWLKGQLAETHKLLDEMGVPRIIRVMRPRAGENEFSLGLPDRIKWLRENWSPDDPLEV